MNARKIIGIAFFGVAAAILFSPLPEPFSNSTEAPLTGSHNTLMFTEEIEQQSLEENPEAGGTDI